MSTSSIQDIDDATLEIVGNFNSTNGISSGGGSNFLTDLVNSASSGIASLFNSSPNSTSTSTSTSTPSDSSSPSSNFFTDLANSIAKLFSSSSSLPSGVAGPGAELVNSGETVTDENGRITVTGRKIPETSILDGIGEWVRNNPAAAVVLGGLAAAATGIFSSGGGGNTTNPPGDTSNQTQPKDPVDPNSSTDPADPNKEVPKQQPTAEEISLAETLGISAGTLSTLLKYGLPALASYLSYQSAKDAQEQARGVSFSASGPTTATRTTYGGSRYSAAQGGVASLAGGGIASLAGGGNILDEDIKTYITNVLSNKKSQQEQAAEINAAAQKTNISRDRIAKATGYDLDVVKQFLGPNIIGQKTREAPYQIYDKASDTYRYVDAVTFENWLNGIPLTPPNPVPDAPVYNGSFVLRGAGSNAEGYPELDYVPSMPDNDGLYEVSDEELGDLEDIVSMRIPSLGSVVDLSNVKTPEQFMFLLRNLNPSLFNEILSSYNNIVKETQPFGPGSYRSVSGEGITGDRDAYRRNVIDEGAWAIYNDPDKARDFAEALQYPELFLTKNQGPAADAFRESFPRWLQMLGTANLSTPNGLESDYAAGGMTTKQPFYLGGSTDGMADEVPAHIDNQRPAALSDGEFVVPADVVSHLGNGNSNAGAKRLYEMMDRIREARTGNSKQGIQVNPNNFMPG